MTIMEPRYFDVHAHVQFSAFEHDKREIVERALTEGVWMMNVGTQASTSKAAIVLAESFPDGVFASVGLHPIHTAKSFHDEKEFGGGEAAQAFSSRGEIFNKEVYRALAVSKKVAAIGECGLDYYRLEPDTKEKQTAAFEEQIILANELNKPLMLHIRDGKTGRDSNGAAYKDALVILERLAKVSGNVHFFAGDKEVARQFLELGFTISFTGVITFTRDYDETIRYLPRSSLLVETDSPYVAPLPHRGKRNEPVYVREIAAALARVRGEDEEVLREALFENGRRVFSSAG